MMERVVAAKVSFAWIAGEEVYGDNRSLRVWLEQHDLHFVLAVRSNQYVWTERMRQETVEQLGHAVSHCPDGEVETAAPACIALTVPEIRKLLRRLVWRYLPNLKDVIHWSL